MKEIYLIMALFMGLSANAQFFQHVYGTNREETNGNGVNTAATGQGHFIVSPSRNTSSTAGDVLATRTNVSGAVTTFNNVYSLASAALGNIIPISAIPMEHSNGSGYGVFGQFYAPTIPVSTTGIYYLQLDVNGRTTGVATEYVPTVPNFTSVVEVGGVAKSAAGTEYYITGTLDVNQGMNFYVFIIKINLAGGIMWSGIYDIASTAFSSRDWGRAIVESPYAPAGVQEVVVAGMSYDQGVAGNVHATFLRFNAATGAPIGTATMYGTNTTVDRFTSIAVAANPLGGVGYVVGGYTNPGTGDDDMWMVKINTTGGVTWSKTYDYNFNSGNQETSWDVLERLNNRFPPEYEYYISGETDAGNIGGRDLVVYKANSFGQAVGLCQFTYGSPNNDWGGYLDMYNNNGGANPDGLSVFGSYSSVFGGLDAYQVKAYFNGVTCGTYNRNITTDVNGPGILSTPSVSYIDDFVTGVLTVNDAPASESNICLTNSISPPGDNARIAPAKTGDDAVLISPNPMQTGTAIVNVDVESEVQSEVSISVYDMIGKEYYNSTFMLAKGINTLPLDLSNAHMAAGMYTVRISTGSTARNVLLMVK